MEATFKVDQVDSQTFQVVHSPSSTQVCVCAEFPGQLKTAKERAETIAKLLNGASLSWGTFEPAV